MLSMNPTAATSSTVGAAAANASKTLSSDEFIKVLLAEVQNQNPLEPMKNHELLNQMTSIQSLEATTNLSEAIRTMMMQQQILGAGSLIGRWVSGLSLGDGRVSGTVDGVRIQGSDVNLVVGDSLVPLANIERMGSAPEDQEGENGS